jgi:serine protease Do
MTRLSWQIGLALALAAVAPALTLTSADGFDPQEGAKPPSRDSQIGQSFRVPYRLTDTNHFLVRVRINGKGPFNFLVDSGAPALFVSTESAKKIGLKPGQDHFWTPINRLDLEGGARLEHIKARVEDPFQLVGMNALGLPGATIDGILGFTILARFRLEIDPTQDRMTWTRLDYKPRDLVVPEHKPGEHKSGPPEVQAMNALGPLAKGLAFLMGRQPEEQRHAHGFLGVEWSQELIGGRPQLRIRHVLSDSAAAKAGLKPGDLLLQIKDQPINGAKAARTTLGDLEPGENVSLLVRRASTAGSRELTLQVTAGEGL